MSKNSPDSLTLRGLIERAGAGSRAVMTAQHRVAFADFAAASPFGEARARLAGLSVILHVRNMALAAAALIDLDGLARRIVLAPPGWGAAELESAAESAEVDAIAHDRPVSPVKVALEATPALPMGAVALAHARTLETEWVLPTSGTTGPPKLVVHTLATLTGAIPDAPRQLWATFYDIRRYGGLQIFLRALSGSGSLWVNGLDETLEEFLIRLGKAGATHIAGTPSHWRKALMSGEAGRIDPEYVRLSGEIADDAILAALGEQYPRARIEHAYASTEAGVGFTVGDRKAGFPAALIEAGGAVKMRIVGGALQLKSERTALRFLGDNAPPLADAEGFVDTGDMVERRGDRYLFVGRRDGVINVGGAKVHPEEVEAVLSAHPAVQACRVFGRKNAITGAVVVADVVLNAGAGSQVALERDIMEVCRIRLAAHKIPTRLRFVPELPLTEGGKLARNG
jgi:acyl-coenzyme A synthetase/AMP-(fatty) acid ligase